MNVLFVLALNSRISLKSMWLEIHSLRVFQIIAFSVLLVHIKEHHNIRVSLEINILSTVHLMTCSFNIQSPTFFLKKIPFILTWFFSFSLLSFSFVLNVEFLSSACPTFLLLFGLKFHSLIVHLSFDHWCGNMNDYLYFGLLHIIYFVCSLYFLTSFINILLFSVYLWVWNCFFRVFGVKHMKSRIQNGWRKTVYLFLSELHT